MHWSVVSKSVGSISDVGSVHVSTVALHSSNKMLRSLLHCIKRPVISMRLNSRQVEFVVRYWIENLCPQRFNLSYCFWCATTFISFDNLSQLRRFTYYNVWMGTKCISAFQQQEYAYWSICGKDNLLCSWCGCHLCITTDNLMSVWYLLNVNCLNLDFLSKTLQPDALIYDYNKLSRRIDALASVAQGVIKAIDNLPYISPIVVVHKKDSSAIWLCVKHSRRINLILRVASISDINCWWTFWPK